MKTSLNLYLTQTKLSYLSNCMMLEAKTKPTLEKEKEKVDSKKITKIRASIGESKQKKEISLKNHSKGSRKAVVTEEVD
jgi:hypothetical protein